MASDQLASNGRRRSVSAALLAVLLFFYEQTLLAQPVEVQLLQTNAQMVTVSGSLQWILALLVLTVSGGFFFAAVRGIRLPAH